MLDIKKMLTKISSSLGKSMFGSVTNVFWWSTTWTAPSDGFIIIRITPNQNADWHLYISDSSISSFAGSWGHQFRGTKREQLTALIPVVKGATYKTADEANVSTVQCLFFPMRIGGGTA